MKPPPALQHAHAKQTFVPADPPGRLGRCGPTVYDLPHLRHAKAYTQFDFLARLPRTRGFAITYVQNIPTWTTRSSAGRASWGSTRPTLRTCARAHLDDMRALRDDSVDLYACASGYIGQVINQIERLEQAGATPAGRAARRAAG